MGESGEELRVQLEGCPLQEGQSENEECDSVPQTADSTQQKLKIQIVISAMCVCSRNNVIYDAGQYVATK